MQYYQGNHKDDYSLQKDNKVCLFHNGVLKMHYQTDKDGNQIGDFTHFENGRAAFIQSFDDIFEKRDFCRIVNHVKGERMEIYSNTSGNRIYHGEFSEHREREGWGIEYDEESGSMLLEGVWKNNRLVEVIRKIEGNIMTEFKLNGNNTIVSNQIPLYVGEFVYDESKELFIRNGIGYLIDEETRIAYREGEWKDGEEVSGRDLYEGWYTRSSSSNSHEITRASAPLSTLIGSVKEPIQRSINLDALDSSTKSLVIPSNCCNNISSMNLNRLKSLESLEIGNECFENVDVFRIDGLSKLKTLKIGENSFTHVKSTVEWKRDLVQNASRSFHIVNCSELSSIDIGEYSFSDYAGQFELKNLPSLEGLKIGRSIGTFVHYIYMRIHIPYINSSSNFTYSSLILRGCLLISIVKYRSSKAENCCCG